MGTWKKAILEGDSTLVPSGGTTGQVLAKNSGTNYDTTWVTKKVTQVTGKTVATGASSW